MKSYLQKYFSDFSESMVNDLVCISKMEQYQKDSIVYFEGEKPTRLYLLIEGSLYEYKSELLKRSQVLRFFEPMNLIGEMSNITDTPYPVSVKCDQDSTLIAIDFRMYMQLFCFDKERGKIGYASLLYSMAQKYDFHLNNCCYSCTQAQGVSAEKRVAKYIFDNLEKFNQDKKWKSAQHLRISPETLSRSLNKLKQKGVIEIVESKVVLADREKISQFILQ